MADALRLVIAFVVVFLLARSARAAWHNRPLALAVWGRIRARHVAGSVTLLAVVLATVVGLTQLVPVTGYGLGTLVGLSGNVVFAPLEEVAVRTAPDSSGAAPSTDWGSLALVAAFLVALLGLFPWLAYVEERIFREGLERAGIGRQLWAALRFGLAHLVMFIPLAAALAIGVAGFAYGRLYRVAYRRAEATALLHPVAGHFGLPLPAPVATAELRRHAVLASTVWHTTFNSVIVLAVLAGFLLDAF